MCVCITYWIHTQLYQHRIDLIPLPYLLNLVGIRCFVFRCKFTSTNAAEVGDGGAAILARTVLGAVVGLVLVADAARVDAAGRRAELADAEAEGLGGADKVRRAVGRGLAGHEQAEAHVARRRYEVRGLRRRHLVVAELVTCWSDARTAIMQSNS
jgi:hypothetical protein